MAKDILFLPDGTELRTCHVPEPIYATADQRIYALSANGLRELKQEVVNTSPGCVNVNRKRKYMRVSFRGKHYFVHRLVALAWLPAPKDGQTEIDHINGVTTDNRVCNLEWVTVAENRKRAVILRARRMIALQDHRPELLPENMQPAELLSLFNSYNVAGDVYTGE